MAKKRIDLHKSTAEEHKAFCINSVKEDLAKHGYGILDVLLSYLYDKAYHKGEVDQYRYDRNVTEFEENERSLDPEKRP